MARCPGFSGVRVVAVLALLIGLSGCTDWLGPSRDLVVRTDRQSYIGNDRILTTIRNVSDRTFSFTACSAGSPPMPHRKLDRRTDERWTELDSWGAYCQHNTVPVEVPLAPGEEIVLVWGVGRSTGTLRFRVVDGPRILGISNTFTVTPSDADVAVR